MRIASGALLILGLCGALAGCGADDPGDWGAPDGADGEEARGTKEGHEACCTQDAPSSCAWGTCVEGLSCYVLPYGMHTYVGICCNGSCQIPCDISACRAACLPGETCPQELTCRTIGWADYCLP